MKIRLGNVSNSSSSSFVISGHELTEYQKFMIANHIEVAKFMADLEGECEDGKECWRKSGGRSPVACERCLDSGLPIELTKCEMTVGDIITEAGDAWRLSGDLMSGDVSMDNFDMVEFLIQIGVPAGCINKEHDNDNW